MNYYVDIIDTQNSDYQTVLENAAKSSIVLSYKGSDAKDELSIVGSTLKFVIKVAREDNVDGAFEHLFTGDETRYKIELRKEVGNVLLWQGFTLPDSYGEPYKNGTLDIDVTATDGLGRLKGKYLPDAYYKDEHKVTDIIAECLKLTGLSMPFYFCPAIENYHKKNFNEIYIPGTDFVDNDKKDDAYKILNYFAEDLLFCVFQSMGYWHLEGLNKRNLLLYTAKEYDADGVFVQDVELSRNVKVINANTLTTPDVSMVVPYGLVSISHDREPQQFKETQTVENNDSWAVTTGVNPEIYSTEWLGYFNPKAVAPDYNVVFYNNNTNAFDSAKYVSLLNKIYISEGQKISIEFAIVINDTLYNQEQNIVQSWTNPIFYKIVFNDTTLYSNFDGPVTGNEILSLVNTKTKKLSFEFAAQENGLLDVVFYQPYKTNEQIVSVGLTLLSMKVIGFNKTETFTDVINENYTIKKEKDLTFSDDPSGFSKCFRLSKLNEIDNQFQKQITVPIFYSFTQNGRYYSVVQLDGANLIAENLDTSVYVEDLNVEILGVVYNYQNNEQMLVETDTPNLTGNFKAQIFARNHGPSDRFQWVEWTDSLYQIERLRFADIHSKIYRRLFKVPHVKADLSINFPVLFNDMLQWQYKGGGNYTISNLRSWDLDSGKVSLSLNKAVYQNDDTENPNNNLPPFVNAFADIYISDTATSASLISESGDPDGFITSYQWQQDTTVAGVSFATPNNQNCVVSNLTEDFYTFKITVTDNEGATAIDTVNVIRLRDYLITFTEIYNNVDTSVGVRGSITEKHYRIDCTPPLPNDFNLTIDANYIVDLDASGIDYFCYANMVVDKNNTEIVNDTYSLNALGSTNYYITTPIPFNYNNTDITIIKLTAAAYFDQPDNPGDTVSARSEIDFNVSAITFASGQGNITTVLPVNKEALVNAVI